MSHHFIECKQVYYSYPDGRKAVNGITFRINHEELMYDSSLELPFCIQNCPVCGSKKLKS